MTALTDGALFSKPIVEVRRQSSSDVRMSGNKNTGWLVDPCVAHDNVNVTSIIRVNEYNYLLSTTTLSAHTSQDPWLWTSRVSQGHGGWLTGRDGADTARYNKTVGQRAKEPGRQGRGREGKTEKQQHKGRDRVYTIFV